MEELAAFGISKNNPKSEFTIGLSRVNTSSLKDLRSLLFDEAKRANLTAEFSVLVRRLDTAVNPVRGKYVEDIWTLVQCIKNSKEIPRTLLKNGKQNKHVFAASQQSLKEDACQNGPHTQCRTPNISINLESQSVSESHPCDSCALPPSCPTTHDQTRYFLAYTSVMRELNILKNEITLMKYTNPSTSEPSYADLVAEVANLRVEIESLRSVSDTPSQTKPSTDTTHVPELQPHSQTKEAKAVLKSLNISAWNCRGLSKAIPYIQLLANDHDIIIISWPNTGYGHMSYTTWTLSMKTSLELAVLTVGWMNAVLLLEGVVGLLCYGEKTLLFHLFKSPQTES